MLSYVDCVARAEWFSGKVVCNDCVSSALMMPRQFLRARLCHREELEFIPRKYRRQQRNARN